MPVLFLGHGSPMNAIEKNVFTQGWKTIGSMLPKPQAILCVSAHWETNGTFVTAVEQPQTIHDFYGFPSELFDVQYPAPGSPALAQETTSTVHSAIIALDRKWGLDHGCWSVVKHLYPDADIPIIQMSLDRSKPASWHYELASELSGLRRKGILIIGSGNMVHNLRIMDWSKGESGFEWAIEANEKMKKMILENDSKQLMRYQSMGKEFQLSIPTPEHYLPLLYTLGLKEERDEISFFNDRTVFGSISMTSLKLS